jgi:hypothetical protein
MIAYASCEIRAIAVLARIATWRHGPLAVVRALARRERAPETIAAPAAAGRRSDSAA